MDAIWRHKSASQTVGGPLIHNVHYDDVIMTMLASQITSLTVVYSIVYSGVNQRKHHSSASLAFVREIHRGPVNFPHKWPVTRKMFPFDDVIMFREFSRITGLWRIFKTFYVLSTLDSVAFYCVNLRRWILYINVRKQGKLYGIATLLYLLQC